MAAGEHAEEDELDGVALPDDGALDLVHDGHARALPPP